MPKPRPPPRRPAGEKGAGQPPGAAAGRAAGRGWVDLENEEMGKALLLFRMDANCRPKFIVLYKIFFKMPVKMIYFYKTKW